MDERAKGLWCQEGAGSACHEAYCAHREACPSDLLDALAAREGEIAKLRPIVEVVASLNLSDIGSMKASDILYWHGGKLTVAHVRAAVAALALSHQDGSNVV